eukprot:2477376-Rhodomonas_salina.1
MLISVRDSHPVPYASRQRLYARRRGVLTYAIGDATPRGTHRPTRRSRAPRSLYRLRRVTYAPRSRHVCS